MSRYPPVKIYIFSGDLKSSFAATRIEKFFSDYRDARARERLAAQHLPASLLKSFDIKQQNVVSAEKVAGETFGGIIPYLVIIMCLTGAMYPAMDLTAGEKERATMETILSSPISRSPPGAGQIPSGANRFPGHRRPLRYLHGYFVLGIPKTTGPVFAQRHSHQNRFRTRWLSVFMVAFPLAVLFSAALITISLFAKSYKEAQSYISPLMIVVVVPAVAAMIPGVELTPKLSLIPILNVSLLCKDLIAGTYHWGSISLIFLSTCVYAAAAIFIAIKMFHRESVLFRS